MIDLIDDPRQLSLIPSSRIEPWVISNSSRQNKKMAANTIDFLAVGMSVFITRILIILAKACHFTRMQAEQQGNSQVVVDVKMLRRVLKSNPQALGPLTGPMLDSLLIHSVP